MQRVLKGPCVEGLNTSHVAIGRQQSPQGAGPSRRKLAYWQGSFEGDIAQNLVGLCFLPTMISRVHCRDNSRTDDQRLSSQEPRGEMYLSSLHLEFSGCLGQQWQAD